MVDDDEHVVVRIPMGVSSRTRAEKSKIPHLEAQSASYALSECCDHRVVFREIALAWMEVGHRFYVSWFAGLGSYFDLSVTGNIGLAS